MGNTPIAKPAEKERIFDVLEQYIDVFAVNPRVVDFCEGPHTIVELMDPECFPKVRHPRSYTPEQRQMIPEEVSNPPEAGAIQPCPSAYLSACHTVRTKDFIVRVVQDSRGLNALLKDQSVGPATFPPSSTTWVDLTALRVCT